MSSLKTCPKLQDRQEVVPLILLTVPSLHTSQLDYVPGGNSPENISFLNTVLLELKYMLNPPIFDRPDRYCLQRSEPLTTDHFP